MKTAFQLPVGYSDHTPGIEIPMAAVALGRGLLKSISPWTRTWKAPITGPRWSRVNWQKMVRAIRHVETALGAESKNRRPVRFKNMSDCPQEPGRRPAHPERQPPCGSRHRRQTPRPRDSTQRHRKGYRPQGQSRPSAG